MAVIVSLDQQYLVDVGFGEFFFRNPIPLDGNVVEEISGYYRVKMSKETGRFLLQQRKKKRWKTRYSFNLNPRQLKDFEGIYQWLISNPNAYTTNVMFRKQLKKGYLGLHNDRLTIIEGNAIRRMQIPWYRSLID